MNDALSSLPIRVLVVDDDADVAKAAALLLNRRGFDTVTAAGPQEAWSLMAARAPDVVLLDLNFSRAQTSGAEGLEVLRRLVAHEPAPAVVVVTGHSGISIAVEAMRAGAADFVMKPWNNERLTAVIAKAAARRRAGGGVGPEAAGDPLETLVGASAAFERARDLVERAGATAAPLLIHGGAGVGKTLAAAVAHGRSSRAGGPLARVDAAHADADAVDAAWRAAQGATLLIEQVEALTPAAQSRLVERFASGGDVRVISTSRLAPDRLSAGALREDLYHRLNTVEVRLPPLSERPGDAELLSAHFLRLFAARHGRPAPAATPEVAESLRIGPWPGEVRGLRLAAERAVLLDDAGQLTAATESEPAQAEGGAPDLNLGRSERALIERSLKLHAFNVSRAAEALGLTRGALYRRMSKHGL